MLTALLPAFFLAATAAAANDQNISKAFAEAIPGLAVDSFNNRDFGSAIANSTGSINALSSRDSGRDPSVAALFNQDV